MSRTSLQKCESEQRFSYYYTVIAGKFNCFFRIAGFAANSVRGAFLLFRDCSKYTK